MSQKPRQKPKKSKAEQIETLIRLINSGKTQSAAATAIGVNIRTVQRWLADPAVRERLVSIQQEASAIAQSDPVVLSVTDIRAQVQEILNYRDSQRSFALEMGLVIQKSTAVLLKAVEKLEQNPDEISARTIPQLLRAVTDAAEKVSNAWSRATGLDDLLEGLKDEPQAISQGQTEA
jgi:transposase